MTAFVQARIATTFPIGTLLVNVTGSFLLGFIIKYALATPAISPEVRSLLTTGFCGGFTTFSTFSLENASLLEEGEYSRVLVYVVASVVLSLLATFAGFALAGQAQRIRG